MAFRWIILLLSSSACGLTACVSAPVQEMSDARQAIKAARDAGAERLAPHELGEARALLQQAESSLQRRAYREARRNAIAAHDKAAEALHTVQPRPSQLRPNSSDVVPADCGECNNKEPAVAAR